MADPIMIGAMVKEGAEFADKGVEIADHLLNLKAKYEREKDEKYLREIDMNLAKLNAVENCLEAGVQIAEIVIKIADSVWKEAKKFFSNDLGSKVKDGAFAKSPIEMFDDHAGIIVNKNTQEVVMLTRDNIQSCRFVKSKKKIIPPHTYYYYHITFHNGQKCYARMRRKYRNAMFYSMLDVENAMRDLPEYDD